jgi:putative transcriptional regulator
MQINTGTILTSSPALDDPNFQKVIILITEHNENGATGFVINKLFHRKLNALEEFKHYPAFPLYDGGPVDKEHLFFIHRRPDLIEGGALITQGIYFGGNFKQAVTNISNKTISLNDIKIFVGYCGWNNDELEEEVNEGSWIITESSKQNIFSAG